MHPHFRWIPRNLPACPDDLRIELEENSHVEEQRNEIKGEEKPSPWEVEPAGREKEQCR
ncbi:MAG: hypothetical protein Q8N79_01735 [Candidatus Methanoperedens sp.]|nr:hypothetical protein [Candidatus Methanoperedens sp.]